VDPPPAEASGAADPGPAGAGAETVGSGGSGAEAVGSGGSGAEAVGSGGSGAVETGGSEVETGGSDVVGTGDSDLTGMVPSTPSDDTGPAGADPSGAGPSAGGGATAGGTATELVAGLAASEAVDHGAPMTRKERREARSDGASGSSRVKRRRTWLDWLLLSGVVVVALALVGITTGYVYVQYRFHQVTKVTVRHLKAVPAGEPFNVLLIGSDSRAGFTSADVAAYGDETTAGGQRSDVVKIVHVVPATGQVSVLSIPRDTMVTVAGDTSNTGTYNRINATYDTGPDQLVQTIEANFGIPIAHVVQLNFVGFRGAVDAIGGVNLDFPYPARDAYTGLDITSPGCQHLDGGYSLAVARSRHYEYYQDGYWQTDGTSDFGRIQRQNAFLKALINQAEKQYNLLTLNAFIGSIVQGITVDTTFTVSELISLAREFRTFSSTTLATATLPTYASSSSEFASYGAVLYVQQPQANQVISQFLGGPAPVAATPPPGPYGVEPTTTTTTAPPGTYSGGGGTTPTTASSETTTTIETDFDPTPC
jgi:LCP family protein required for cell wall assembly